MLTNALTCVLVSLFLIPQKQVTQPNKKKKKPIDPKEVTNKIPLVHAKKQGRNNPISGQPVI